MITGPVFLIHNKLTITLERGRVRIAQNRPYVEPKNVPIQPKTFESNSSRLNTSRHTGPEKFFNHA